MPDRILDLRRVPARELIPNPKNWRRHPEAQRRALRAMLDDIGYADVLLARETPAGLELIDGHLRAEATPDAEVPVLVLDLNEEEAAKLLASLDPLGAMAETDSEALAALLEAVALPEELLAALGAQVGRNGGTQGHTEPDEAPPVPKTPRTRLGDLWSLGDHRLLCGDATVAEAWDRLMAGEPADLVWTDPPYGVDYQAKMRVAEARARHRRTDGKVVTGDDLGEAEHAALVRSSFALAASHQKKGGAWYVAAPSGPQLRVFAEVLSEMGIWRQIIIWVKDQLVLGRGDYHNRHEVVFYGWKPGAAHRWWADRTQDSVWEIARPKRSEEHPTMKPVELVLRALENSAPPKALIIDPFSGSGTTIIAAAMTRRRCFAMELDPRYVDVAVTRWEQFTDQKAERIRG